MEREKEVFVVKKLGGENASDMFKSAENVLNDAKNGVKQTVVISAMRGEKVKVSLDYSSLEQVMREMGEKKETDPKKQVFDTFNTTDVLKEIGEECGKGKDTDDKKVIKYIKALRDFHCLLIKEKLKDFPEILGEADRVMNHALNNIMSHITDFLSQDDYTNLPSAENDYTIQDKNGEPISIIGFGEVLSAKIFSTVINELSKLESPQVQSIVIDTSKAIGEILGGSAFMTLAQNLAEKVHAEEKISIIPGYVGGFEGGIESAVGRGYSDATAAALAVGMKNLGYSEVTLEIQKSVRGMLSADPRILDNPEDAKLIEQVDYILAKEIIGGAKAKLLHDQALRKEVIESGVQVKIWDPFDLSSPGTLIGHGLGKKNTGVLFIGKKDAIICTVSSVKMGEKGNLNKIFSKVKDYASVDVVGVSETEVSFTIESGSAQSLDQMKKDLEEVFDIKEGDTQNFIKLSPEKSTIHIVGNFKGTKGLLAQITTLLSENDINISMISQGIEERAMILGVDLVDAQKAVNVLHTHFIK